MLLRQLEEEKKGLKEHVTRLEDLLKQQKEVGPFLLLDSDQLNGDHQIVTS